MEIPRAVQQLWVVLSSAFLSSPEKRKILRIYCDEKETGPRNMLFSLGRSQYFFSPLNQKGRRKDSMRESQRNEEKEKGRRERGRDFYF